MKNAKLTNEDATCEKGSSGFKMFRPKLYKPVWQKDLLQTSSHVLLFNTDVSPVGLLQCIYKLNQNLDKNTQFGIAIYIHSRWKKVT